MLLNMKEGIVGENAIFQIIFRLRPKNKGYDTFYFLHFIRSLRHFDFLGRYQGTAYFFLLLRNKMICKLQNSPGQVQCKSLKTKLASWPVLVIDLQ